MRRLKESSGVKSMMHHGTFQGQANYDNPAVQVRFLNISEVGNKTKAGRVLIREGRGEFR